MPRRRLGAWGEIAAYLKCNERTARRWERDEGLPIHRHLHNKQGTVYAFSDEIDEWIHGRRPEPKPDPIPWLPPFLQPLSRWRFSLGVTLAAVLSFGLGFWISRIVHDRQQSSEPSIRFSFSAGDVRPVISPNGRHIAYFRDGRLWIRELANERPREVPGAEAHDIPVNSDNYVTWSPDSRDVAFFDGRDVRRVSIEGPGAPATITSPAISPQSWLSGLAWSRDSDTIVFGVMGKGIFEAPARGGPPTLLLKHEHAEELTLAYQESGDRVLLYVASDGSFSHKIVARTKDGQDHIVASIRNLWGELVWSPTGRIIYRRGMDEPRSVWALPFSVESLKAQGDGFPLYRHAQSPSLSRDGTLVYLDRGATRKQYLVWRARSGAELGRVGPSHEVIDSVDISPDGEHAIVVARDADRAAVWVYELRRGSETRVSFPDLDANYASWGKSNTEVMYTGFKPGVRFPTDVFVQKIDAELDPQLVFSHDGLMGASERTADGSVIIYTRGIHPRGTIWYWKRRVDSSEGEVVQFSKAQGLEMVGWLSPGGRYLVYCAGTPDFIRIFVRPFPDGDGRWQISRADDARAPRWSADGKEIFFEERGVLMREPVSTEGGFSVGEAEPLFEHPNLTGGAAPYPRYDVSPDGRRFLTIETEDATPEPRVRVVQDWFREFGAH